ncbi:hypothetical protein PZB74_11380 [Porifericola rhodea]|uniref:hypothetical protein n=1 Tax=Porifericola rhodea TaxID=930972 RepID=UPI002666542E|nr:hypothetical protein [Porifericola rhodea]WKN29565.1 hypothetical protein PZB74_11380 [Porifericola rhodea]
MSDHEFDALFKQAAQKLEVPYNPKGWKRMQQKLGASQLTIWGQYKKRLLAFSILMVLLSIGRWIDQHQRVEDMVLVELNPQAPQRVFDQLPAKPPIKSKAAENTKSTNGKEDQRDIQALENTESINALRHKLRSAVKVQSTEARGTEEANNSRSLMLNTHSAPSTLLLLEPYAIREEQWVIRYPEVTALVEAEQRVRPPELMDSIKAVKAGRWGLSFGLSPDLSGVGLKNIHRISTKVRGQLEFFILPALSLNSGVIFSNKIYNASAEDYSQKYTNSYKPENINGECQVLDIPINLRWYALANTQSRWFISGGLSSYLMLSEDYEYVYYNKGQHYSRDYSYKNENRHPFKVANFSLGYEKSLGKHWAIQAEPFVKVPLAGVGEGKIKLATMGTFFSLHYRWGR